MSFISCSWFKGRLRLFQHRYSRLLTAIALIITYATAVIVVFKLRSGFVIMYGVILLFIALVALVWLIIMFICSLFGKGRFWFDETFHYSDTELIPHIIRLDKLEKRMAKVESIIKKILKEVRYKKMTNTREMRGKRKAKK